MGDRAMAEIRTEDGSLYVYTHWQGHNLPERAKEAVRFAKGRWTDTPYAMRILVDQLTKNSRDELTGAGLLLTPKAEDEYNGDKPSVIINLKELTLKVIRDRKEQVWSFQDL